MDRRRFLAAAGAAGLASTAGCVARVTGWSSLTLRIGNTLDRPARLRVTVDVNGEREFARRVDLAAGARRTTDVTTDVPWGATLAFRAVRPGTGGTAMERWEASIPLWGGNACTIEPVIEITPDGPRIGPACL